jgi:signal transduction histidine kinase
MARAHSKRSFGLALSFALLALLLLLAFLQYRWTGALGRAEEERLRSGLAASVARFAGELDFEMARVLRPLSMRPAAELPDALAEMRRDGHYPEIVSGVYRVGFEGGRLEVSRVGADGALASVAPPRFLERVRERAEAVRHEHRGRPRGSLPLFLVSSDPIAIVVPARPEPGARGPAVTVAVFQNEVIAAEVLPDIAERVFGSEDSRDFDLAVVDDAGRVVFSTQRDSSEIIDDADESSGLLTPGSPPRERRRAGAFMPPPPGAGPRFTPRPLASAPRERGPWTLYARHRDGSLDAVVGRVRARNLALGTGVLFLLGASVVLLTISARRAMELSEKKMEFVAGVSHELRTPLAVIRSAAQNLSDGSVSGAPQVQRYGGLIEAESRRLEDLVENVLGLAGVESKTRRAVRERVSITAVVRAAIAASAAEAAGRGVEVEAPTGDSERFVVGDEDALRRGVANLVTNAIKHGGEDNKVTVSIEGSPGEVAIAISDRGPGIPASEIPRLFEPFYRGRRARDRQVRGSGLGLRLVQEIAREHGGRVEVDSHPGRGSRFALVLPEA